MEIQAWTVHEPGQPMVLDSRNEQPGDHEVLIEVAGCGVCHTDLGFYYDGVPTRHELPLTLGHEISGTVVAAGAGAESLVGRAVIVPAVIPCGDCDACRADRGPVCAKQIFPGNDVHGGFATHVRVPATGLCPVPDLSDKAANPHGLTLASLSVIADAVTTPYQAILRSGLEEGELAVFVGCGGVGGFGVQIAAARGATVVALDVDEGRLAAMQEHGASLGLHAGKLEFRALKKQLKEFAAVRRIPTYRWRIFETSGTPEGQSTAFGLMGHGSYLSIVGYSPEKVSLRLSNVMALDATVQGNWGCLPEHYPAVLDLVLSGHVQLEPFIEPRPMSSINETFQDLRAHRVSRRVVLHPQE